MGRDGAISRDDAALGRDFTRKMARHLQPSVPAWDQAGPALPWWETVPQNAATHKSDEIQVTSFSPQSEIGAGERGWTPLKRILIALAGLAALFLAAGAHTQW
jgi:hypothetical protein